MKRFCIIFFSIIALASCATKKAITPPITDRYSDFLIDSILQYGLDHEAVYTLFGNVKPMSSLISLSFPIANVDTSLSTSGNILNRDEHGVHLDRIRAIQQAINNIQLPDMKVVMIPYKSPGAKKSRTMQLSVIRVSALDSLLKAKESFFGQFGLVPGSDPVAVVNTIEYSDRYERLRGYGYLFGYPDYAVDFFVEASQVNDRTGQFVERNFFQIPVYSATEGYFVYAYPREATPTATVDSVLYNKASLVLDQYKQTRSHYLNADSTVQAYQLLRDLSK